MKEHKIKTHPEYSNRIRAGKEYGQQISNRKDEREGYNSRIHEKGVNPAMVPMDCKPVLKLLGVFYFLIIVSKRCKLVYLFTYTQYIESCVIDQKCYVERCLSVYLVFTAKTYIAVLIQLCLCVASKDPIKHNSCNISKIAGL